eukprot:CAMPEP_0167769650 /NCGR_PEP_ID=MMETSP0110_2-20121227/17439_1 /TAXON_ID=629695 /ORGANISM="Gymnochlora sp., Strain CCMP2014" /LENGTH=655 /DNA_ID=CAMNT_0007658655 /DNA_START=294 /DNA_END=2262 /DNA_ORIENTATION=-
MVSSLDWADERNHVIFQNLGISAPNDLPCIKIFDPDGEVEDYEGKNLSKLADDIVEQIQKYVANNLARLMPLLAPKQKTYKSFKKDKSMPRVVMILEPKGKSKARKMTYEAISALSIYFEGRIKFGYSKHKKVSKAFGGGSLPAVFFVPSGKKFDENRQYTGTLAYRPIKTWLEQFAGTPENLPSAIPPAFAVDTIPQITSKSCLDKFCVSRGGICVFSLLPQLSISKGEMSYYLESMRLVRRALVDKLGIASFSSIHFSWIDSSAQMSWLERTFGLPPAEYSQTIVWYPKKEAWGQYVGSFSPPEISRWVTLASKGKANVEPMTASLDTLSEMEDSKEASASCDQMDNPLPDEVVVSTFKEKSKRKGSRKQRKNNEYKSPPNMAATSKRLPRPRAKGGKSYTLTPEIQDTIELAIWFQKDDDSSGNETWTKIARNVKGMIQFGVVDPKYSTEILKSLDISPDDAPDGPRIRLFPSRNLWGEDIEGKAEASSWFEMDLSKESSPDMIKKILGILRQSGRPLSFMIDDKNSLMNFQAFYQANPNPGLPRIILIPSKDLQEPPFLIEALAVEFGHIISFGVAKNTDEGLKKQFGIEKTPSLVIISAQGQPDANGQLQLGVLKYPGHMSFNAISAFLERTIRIGPSPPSSDQNVKDEL